MTAERADRTVEERLSDLEAIVATLIGEARVNEPQDPSQAHHRAFVAMVRERERQA